MQDAGADAESISLWLPQATCIKASAQSCKCLGRMAQRTCRAGMPIHFAAHSICQVASRLSQHMPSCQKGVTAHAQSSQGCHRPMPGCHKPHTGLTCSKVRAQRNFNWLRVGFATAQGVSNPQDLSRHMRGCLKLAGRPWDMQG